jgi:hypothetical protein
MKIINLYVILHTNTKFVETIIATGGHAHGYHGAHPVPNTMGGYFFGGPSDQASL